MTKVIYAALALSAILVASQTLSVPSTKNYDLDSILVVCPKCKKPNCGGHRA
jgi:hypothetical protein